MSNSYDISIEQGSSFNLSLTARDITGEPINLSGYATSGELRYSYGSSGVLLNLNPTVDPSLVSGIINISLTPEQTASLPVTKAVYDIEVISSGGFVFKAIRGYAEIAPEVSRV